MTLFTLPNYRAKALKEDFSEEEKKFQKFEITIPSAETTRAYRKNFGRSKEKGLLILVKVPKSLFGQETGEVRVWFDQKMTPVEATIEDAIFFGDVIGVLVKSKISP
jgi:uroporphyrinogen-III synthase